MRQPASQIQPAVAAISSSCCCLGAFSCCRVGARRRGRIARRGGRAGASRAVPATRVALLRRRQPHCGRRVPRRRVARGFERGACGTRRPCRCARRQRALDLRDLRVQLPELRAPPRDHLLVLDDRRGEVHVVRVGFERLLELDGAALEVREADGQLRAPRLELRASRPRRESSRTAGRSSAARPSPRQAARAQRRPCGSRSRADPRQPRWCAAAVPPLLCVPPPCCVCLCPPTATSRNAPALELPTGGSNGGCTLAAHEQRPVLRPQSRPGNDTRRAIKHLKCTGLRTYAGPHGDLAAAIRALLRVYVRRRQRP